MHDAAPASKLVLRSEWEGLGECTVTSRGWSMSSRGTAYPSRATSTVSCDLRARKLPGATAVPIDVRPERTRPAVRVTLEKRDGRAVYCADSRADFRRRRSASSQRLRVCSRKKTDRQCAGLTWKANAPDAYAYAIGKKAGEGNGRSHTYLFDSSRLGSSVGRGRVCFVQACALFSALDVFILVLYGLRSLSFGMASRRSRRGPP